MRPNCIEVASPTFDDDLGLAQRVEDFTIEQFIAQARVEALDVTVFPGTAWHARHHRSLHKKGRSRLEGNCASVVTGQVSAGRDPELPDESPRHMALIRKTSALCGSGQRLTLQRNCRERRTRHRTT